MKFQIEILNTKQDAGAFNYMSEASIQQSYWLHCHSSWEQPSYEDQKETQL